MDTGIQVAALIVIASFAIDRVSGGTFFLLSLFEIWNRHFPDPATIEDPIQEQSALKRTKLAYYCLAGFLAAVLVFKFDISVLKALQVGDPLQHPWLDHLFSVLVLLGGSDQIAALLKSPHAGKAPEGASHQPIEVTGKLMLEDGGRQSPRSSRTGTG
jgi:hypothetical protein